MDGGETIKERKKFFLMKIDVTTRHLEGMGRPNTENGGFDNKLKIRVHESLYH